MAERIPANGSDGPPPPRPLNTRDRRPADATCRLRTSAPRTPRPDLLPAAPRIGAVVGAELTRHDVPPAGRRRRAGCRHVRRRAEDRASEPEHAMGVRRASSRNPSGTCAIALRTYKPTIPEAPCEDSCRIAWSPPATLAS